MPWHKVRNHSGCSAGKPIAVVKDSDGSVAGCHASQASADDQLAALYANEGKSTVLHNQPGDHPSSVSIRSGNAAYGATPELEHHYGYLHSSYQMNDRLRGGTGKGRFPDPRFTDAVFQSNVRGLDGAFAKAPPLDESIMTHRGVWDSSKMFGTTAEVGHRFTDHGYTSTSSEHSVADEFRRGGSGQDTAMINVIIPKGSRAGRIGNDIQNEVLLPRSTTFIVTGDRHVSGIREIDVEVDSQQGAW